MDGKWKHQRADYKRKDRKISRTELVRVITGHKQGPDQNATQLVDVVNGLAFMHDLHVIHGELRGVSLRASRSSTKANILINRYQRSSLISNTPMSLTARGTYRAPELLDPKWFGMLLSENNRPTRQSDCYVLGMVIYEVDARVNEYHCR